MIFDAQSLGQNHSSDLRVWMELRGFDPLTPRNHIK